jgi:hypothetical protein
VKLWHLSVGLIVLVGLIVGYAVRPNSAPIPVTNLKATVTMGPPPTATVASPARTAKTYNLWRSEIRSGRTTMTVAQRDIENRVACELLARKEIDSWLRYASRSTRDTVTLRDPQTNEPYSLAWRCADSTVDLSALSR